MDRQIVLKQDILDALSAVGMHPGQTVMVHARSARLDMCAAVRSR